MPILVNYESFVVDCYYGKLRLANAILRCHDAEPYKTLYSILELTFELTFGVNFFQNKKFFYACGWWWCPLLIKLYRYMLPPGVEAQTL